MTGPAKWPVFKANAEACQTGQSYVWRSNAGAGLLWQSRTDRFGGSHAKAPQDFGPQGGIVDRATMQLGLRISRKLFRSDQIDHAVLRVIANEGASIFALDGGFGTQHGDALRTRCGTSGLDRRNGADKRHGEFFSQGRQRDG